jgi:hypothetical protein
MSHLSLNMDPSQGRPDSENRAVHTPTAIARTISSRTSNLARRILARQFDKMARQAKAKHRSPNYPRLAFDAAPEKTHAVYEQHSASREVIA